MAGQGRTGRGGAGAGAGQGKAGWGRAGQQMLAQRLVWPPSNNETAGAWPGFFQRSTLTGLRGLGLLRLTLLWVPP